MLISATLVLAACSGEETLTSEKNEEVLTDSLTAPVDTVVMAVTGNELFDAMREETFVNEAQFLEELKLDLQNMNSEADLYDLYYSDRLAEGLDYLNQYLSEGSYFSEWYDIGTYMPCYEYDYFCGDCPQELAINYTPLYTIALRTDSKDDDLIFKAIWLMYNGNEEFSEDLALVRDGDYALYTVDCCCDSRGGEYVKSELGTGLFSKVMDALNQVLKTDNIWVDEAKSLRGMLAQNISGFDVFNESEKNVLAELDKLIENYSWSDTEKASLEKERLSMESGSEYFFDGECE